MNQLGKEGRAFFFLLDFDLKQPIILPLDEINTQEIKYSINGNTNVNHQDKPLIPIKLTYNPIPFKTYKKAFEGVQKALRFGNSYLTNLTFPTPIQMNCSLEEVFHQTQARYKIWLKDQFVCFSPEIFVQIKNGIISSNPMKGTINALLPNAAVQLLDNQKELAEHHTIVDLIRNDLNRVAKQIRVEKFRYIDRIQTNQYPLLQASSKITGVLPSNYQEKLGDIFAALLPAGSISGAPKKKTVEIIRRNEVMERGYYTGICGIFNGENVDSGVMIRFMEQTSNGLVYKSGGGITVQSNVEEEYQELIDKVYVPIARKHTHTPTAHLSA